MLRLCDCVLCEKKIVSTEELDFVHIRRMTKGIAFHKSCFDSISDQFFQKYTSRSKKFNLWCSCCRRVITPANTFLKQHGGFVDLINVSWKCWDDKCSYWSTKKTVLFHPKCFLDIAGLNYYDLLSDKNKSFDSHLSKSKVFDSSI